MNTKPKISDELDHVLNHMARLNPMSEEYEQAAKSLKLVVEAQKSRTSWVQDYAPLIMAGTAVLQTVLIMSHERLNVISTKAIQFVLKGGH